MFHGMTLAWVMFEGTAEMQLLAGWTQAMQSPWKANVILPYTLPHSYIWSVGAHKFHKVRSLDYLRLGWGDNQWQLAGFGGLCGIFKYLWQALLLSDYTLPCKIFLLKMIISKRISRKTSWFKALLHTLNVSKRALMPKAILQVVRFTALARESWF